MTIEPFVSIWWTCKKNHSLSWRWGDEGCAALSSLIFIHASWKLSCVCWDAHVCLLMGLSVCFCVRVDRRRFQTTAMANSSRLLKLHGADGSFLFSVSNPDSYCQLIGQRNKRSALRGWRTDEHTPFLLSSTLHYVSIFMPPFLVFVSFTRMLAPLSVV